MKEVNSLKKLKRKDGSIIIGLMFLVVVIVSIFVFAFETGMLFIIKHKAESVAKNISSSVVLQLDKEILETQGIMALDGNEEQIAGKILKESKLETSMFPTVTMNIEKSIKHEKVEVLSTVEMNSDRRFVFYKNITIRGASKHKATLTTDLWRLPEEELGTLNWNEIWEMIKVEEVF